jgi:hypothetical protein
MEVDAKVRPPSGPRNLWIPCGESRGACGLSLRPRLHCKHLSRKRPLKRAQIAIKAAVVRRKKWGPDADLSRQSRRARSPAGYGRQQPRRLFLLDGSVLDGSAAPVFFPSLVDRSRALRGAGETGQVLLRGAVIKINFPGKGILLQDIGRIVFADGLGGPILFEAGHHSYWGVEGKGDQAFCDAFAALTT